MEPELGILVRDGVKVYYTYINGVYLESFKCFKEVPKKEEDTKWT